MPFAISDFGQPSGSCLGHPP